MNETGTRYSVFLSYSAHDETAIEVIAHRLHRQVGIDLFLDRWHLIPGEPWQETVEEALTQSDTVAVFIGPSGISPWYNEQMRAALDRAARTRDEYRVIPVLLPGAKRGELSRLLVTSPVEQSQQQLCRGVLIQCRQQDCFIYGDIE